jgi:diadenosine tetraphosphate (Ap4A) HIT family hydrolase
MRFLKNCPICGDVARNVDASGVVQLYGQPALRHCILYEDEDLLLIPGPGTFAIGYLILVPRQHVTSFAALDRSVLARTDQLCATYANALATRLGTGYVGFEHGAGDEQRPGAGCVDHAHLHLAPAPEPAALHARLEANFVGTVHAGLVELATRPVGKPYILFGFEGRWRSYDAPVVERQLLRRLLAAQHGRAGEWNWRTHPNLENFWKTVLTIREMQGELVA